MGCFPLLMRQVFVFILFMPSCGTCKEPLQSCEDTLRCDKCKKCHHWPCTGLNDYQIKLHKKNPYKPWRCQNCTEKYCIDCNKTFPKDNEDSICCDKCSFWYHQQCSKLTDTEFQNFCSNPSIK